MAMPSYLQKAVDFTKQASAQQPVQTAQKPGLSSFVSKPKGVGTQILDFIANAGNAAVAETIRGSTKLGGLGLNLITNPIGTLKGTAGENFLQKGGEWMAQQVEQGSQKLNPNQGTSGKGSGKFLGSVAAQVPFLAAGGEALAGAKIAGEGGQMLSLKPSVKFLASSLGQTGIMTGESEGRLPTAKEAVGFGALDLLFHGLGKGLYKSAFKADKMTEMSLKKQFGTTMADIAEKLGYSGTSKGIEKQAITAEGSIWKKLVDAAKTAKGATREDFAKVADDIAKQFDKLPDSEYKTAAMQEVKDAVMKYAPTDKGIASGEQIVGVIGEINQNLFGQSGKSVLTPAKIASLESDIKTGLKDLLPPEVKSLYKEYAMNKQIEALMKNNQVKQAVMSSMLFGSAAGGTSLASGADPFTIAKNTILGAITGAISQKLGTNTFIKTTGGQSLKFIQKSSFMKNLTKQVIDALTATQTTPATPPQQNFPTGQESGIAQTTGSLPQSRPPLQNFVK